MQASSVSPWRLKALFIVVNCLVFCFHMFRFQFLTTYLHLTTSQYGDAQAVMAAVGLLGTPLWSAVADVTGRHRLVLGALTLATAASFQLLAFVHSYAHVMCVLSLYALSSAGLVTLAEHIVLQLLGPRGLAQYGHQRLWGTLSFGAISALVGQCLHWADGAVWPLFVLIPAAALAVLIALLSLPSVTPLQIKAKKNDDHSSSSTLLNTDGFLVRIRRLVSSRSVTLLFLIVFLTGCARAVASLFLPAFWSRHLQLSPSEIGLATNSAVVAEVLIFLNGPWFERRLGSKSMLFLAQIAAAIRACAYVWLEDATFSNHFHMVLSIYSVELLKGVAFGLTQLAAVKVVTESAPAGTQATAQALYTCFYAQLPSVLSAFVGARLDTQTLFSGTAALSLLGLFTTAGVFAFSK